MNTYYLVKSSKGAVFVKSFDEITTDYFEAQLFEKIGLAMEHAIALNNTFGHYVFIVVSIWKNI